jgi:hypothetical protein
MTDNITILPGAEQSFPHKIQADVVKGLEVLLEQAKRGEVQCLIGAALNPDGKTFEYTFGHPGNGIALMGQLEMVSHVLKMQALQTRRNVYQPF